MPRPFGAPSQFPSTEAGRRSGFYSTSTSRVVRIHDRLDAENGIARVEEQHEAAVGPTRVVGVHSLNLHMRDEELPLASGKACRLQLRLHRRVSQGQLLGFVQLLLPEAERRALVDRQILDLRPGAAQAHHGRDGLIRVIVVLDHIGPTLTGRRVLVLLVSFHDHRSDSLAACRDRARSFVARDSLGRLIYFLCGQWLERRIHRLFYPCRLILCAGLQRPGNQRRCAQKRRQRASKGEMPVENPLHPHVPMALARNELTP